MSLSKKARGLLLSKFVRTAFSTRVSGVTIVWGRTRTSDSRVHVTCFGAAFLNEIRLAGTADCLVSPLSKADHRNGAASLIPCALNRGMSDPTFWRWRCCVVIKTGEEETCSASCSGSFWSVWSTAALYCNQETTCSADLLCRNLSLLTRVNIALRVCRIWSSLSHRPMPRFQTDWHRRPATDGVDVVF